MRLEEKGFITIKNGLVHLTEKGETALARYTLEEKTHMRPKRWDKKWRVIIFDINEKRKRIRESVRRMLLSFGFVRLQDSVWVYPYDCEDLIVLLKAELKIGKELLYMIVDSIENDTGLKRHFEIH